MSPKTTIKTSATTAVMNLSIGSLVLELLLTILIFLCL
jgi:hypothetical protein